MADDRFWHFPHLTASPTSALRPIVLQKSKIERRRKPRRSWFLAYSAAAVFRSAAAMPWSSLCETMWSLISRRAKRISGSKSSRSSPQKDFCNTIRPKAVVDVSGICVCTLHHVGDDRVG